MGGGGRGKVWVQGIGWLGQGTAPSDSFWRGLGGHWVEAGGGVEEGRSRGLVVVQTSPERQPIAHLPAASPSGSRPLHLGVSFPRPPCCAHRAANPSLFRPRRPRAQLNPRTVPSLSLPQPSPLPFPFGRNGGDWTGAAMLEEVTKLRVLATRAHIQGIQKCRAFHS